MGRGEGDYFLGVDERMDLYLTTKEQEWILKFSIDDFLSRLRDDYEKYGNMWTGQKITMSDMNRLGKRSTRKYMYIPLSK